MEGVESGGRAAWAGLIHPAWGRLGFVGIYGPNEMAGRISLWTTLVQELDPTFHWILVGDFNMIVSERDQLGGGRPAD